MIWRNWAWRGRMFILLMVLTLPMLVFLIPNYVMDQESADDQRMSLFLILAAFLLLIVMHNWLSIRDSRVYLGFFPLYRRSLSISEIHYVIPVEFEPMRDFGGYGIKGLAKARNGILLGGNPKHGLMIEMLDRRRYVLSFANPQPILHALEEQGCVISTTPLTREDADQLLSQSLTSEERP